MSRRGPPVGHERERPAGSSTRPAAPFALGCPTYGRRPPRGWRARGRSPRRQGGLRRRQAPARGPVPGPSCAGAASPSRGALRGLPEQSADASAAFAFVARLRLGKEEEAGETLELEGNGPLLGGAVVDRFLVLLGRAFGVAV